MGIWLDALELAAAGRVDDAVDLARTEIRRSLVIPITDSDGSLDYAGVLTTAVRSFGARQVRESSRRRVESYRREIVDKIVDDITDEVLRNIDFIQMCRTGSPATLDELARFYPWDRGLKRDVRWKRNRVADLLRSMLGEGLDLPSWVEESLGAEGERRFEFDEFKAAIDSERVRLTWSSFRRMNDLDREVLSAFDDESSEEVGDESVDYVAIRVARQAVEGHRRRRVEEETVLHMLGKELQPQLIAIVETHHHSKPSDGYRPIAWHSVYWTVESDWEGLRMTLPSLDPFYDNDGALSKFIEIAYHEVSSTSRPVICRRRLTLYDACKSHINQRIAERFGIPNTRLSTPDT